tara:strand:+ start:1737 stop:3344 length:1608 start_codon:yes stop_codon:yes gene_type:complete
MTSQVAILTSEGVALASDSAVTFGDDRTYNSVNKILPLGGLHQVAFMGSEAALNPTNGLSWDRIIARFIENKLGEKQKKSLSEYADAFIKFMKEDELMFNADQNSRVVYNSLTNWLNSHTVIRQAGKIRTTADEAYHLLSDWSTTDDDEDPESLPVKMHSRAMDEVPSFLRWLHRDLEEKSDIYPPFTPAKKISLKEDLEQFHSDALEMVCESFFDRWDMPEDGTDWPQLIKDICVMQMSRFPDPRQARRPTRNPRADDCGPNFWLPMSTIAIAGFGSNDLSPGMVELRTAPVIIPTPSNRGLKGEAKPYLETVFTIRNIGLKEIREEGDRTGFLVEKQSPDDPRENRLDAPAFIKPYAWNQEMDNILNGIHEHILRGTIEALPREVFDKVVEWIKLRLDEDHNGIGTATKLKIEEALKSREQNYPELIQKYGDFDEIPLNELNLSDVIGHNIMSKVNEHRVLRRQYFRTIASGLPIKELTELARTLVHIEAEICNWLHPVKAVGGDIDVAYITKEGGFEFVVNKSKGRVHRHQL